MAEAGPIPFKEAIEFFSAKVNLPTRRFDDLRHGAHVRGFSVAGITRDDWLTEIRAAIDKAQLEGTGLKEFQTTFKDFVKRTGWQPKGRGDSPSARTAWRAKIIYKTNMRVSYMAGRYRQMMDPDVLKYRPYWEYLHSGALHPRKMHLSWNHLVLAATDPAWKIMFPPNGWGCGCDVRALSKRDLAKLGKSGPDQAPDLAPFEGKDPRTGETETRYAGVDRGWEYNPGEEWLSGIVPKQLDKPLPAPSQAATDATLPPLPEPVRVRPSQLMDAGLSANTYERAFLRAFGLEIDQETYYRDKSGGIITISPSLFAAPALASSSWAEGRNALLIAEAIQDPHEIWVDWAKLDSDFILRRSYVKRFELPDGQTIVVRFEWTKSGWRAITAAGDQDARRSGALLYSAKG